MVLHGYDTDSLRTKGSKRTLNITWRGGKVLEDTEKPNILRVVPERFLTLKHHCIKAKLKAKS